MPPTLVTNFKTETPAIVGDAASLYWIVSGYVPTMMQLACRAEVIVAVFSIDLDKTTPQTAFTVPDGYEFRLTKVGFGNASADVSAGDPVGVKDRLGADVVLQDLADFSATGTYKTVPVSGVVPVYQPGDPVVIECASAFGSPATLEADLIGYFRRLPVNYLTEDDGDRLTDDTLNYLIEG